MLDSNTLRLQSSDGQPVTVLLVRKVGTGKCFTNEYIYVPAWLTSSRCRSSFTSRL